MDRGMAEALDDEDDAPMPDAALELELIDMPPALASAPPLSNLERCIALRLVHGAGPQRLQKMPLASRPSLLTHVSVVSCVFPALEFPRPATPVPGSQAPRQ